jgi:hypothetical protein
MLKHEVGVSIGAFPVVAITPSLTYSINTNYYYNFNEKHSIGCSAAGTVFQPNAKNTNIESWIAAQLNYRFSYFRKGSLSLYLTASCGFQSIFTDNDYFATLPAYLISPIGISMGSHHNTVIEIGYGTQGIIKIGYQYKFNSNK